MSPVVSKVVIAHRHIGKGPGRNIDRHDCTVEQTFKLINKIPGIPREGSFQGGGIVLVKLVTHPLSPPNIRVADEMAAVWAIRQVEVHLLSAIGVRTDQGGHKCR